MSIERPLPFVRCICLLLLGSLLPAQLREKRIVPLDASQSQGFTQRKSVGVAILVGIGKYPLYTGLERLRYPESDADLLKRELEAQRYTVVALKNEEATKEAVLGAIRQAGQVLDRSGVTIFFFSGHGFSVAGENYLATFDASASNLAQSGLPLKAVEQALNAAGAKRRVLLIDACRNEPVKGVGTDRSFAKFEAAEGTHILFSTRPGAVSYEDDELQHGIFSYSVIEGLRGLAARPDSLVSFHDLAEFVIDGVKRRSLSQGKIQVPSEGGESTGDFLLAALGEPPTPAADGAGAIALGTTGVVVNSTDRQRYVWIPAGSFLMGCSPDDEECYDDESPPHRVNITKGFWMAQTPTTFGAWTEFARKTGRQIPPGDDKFGRKTNALAGNDSLPVVSVAYDDARAFCGWAGLRLPTEAEWEYAARAETVGSRYGNLDAIAWYGDNSGTRRIDTAQLWEEDSANFDRLLFENGNLPKPVGQKQPNPWKLFDMLGNVWQWTADWYGEDYYSRSETADPQGPLGGDKRILRGGSWASFPRLVRVSYRERYEPAKLHDNVGFRCAGNRMPGAP